MKILAINGSHQKENGINELFIQRIFKGASSLGAECKMISLAKMNIKPCVVCHYCQKQDHYACIYDDKDDFLSIVQQIKEADLVIYATPIYIFQMSGILKTFFDRFYSRGKSHIKQITKSHLFFHDIEKELCQKPFVSIIVSDNLETKTTLNTEEYFKTFSKFFDAPHIATIVRNSCFIFKDKKNLYEKKAQNILYHFELAGKELTKMKLPHSIIKEIERKIIPIPSFIFKILKRFSLGQKKLLKKATV